MNEYQSIMNSTPTSFAYDDNGNLLFDGENNYQYNEKNQLIEFNNGIDLIQYKYDALGRRIQKDVGGEITYYFYIGHDVAEEISINESISYIYGQFVDDIISMKKSGNNYFFHKNEIGSIIGVSDNDGLIIERYDYSDFGKPKFLESDFSIIPTSQIQCQYLFTGRRFDYELNQYYYRHREYNPKLGRFLQRDPYGYLSDFNLYQYVYSNPINYVDPLGAKGVRKLILKELLKKGLDQAFKWRSTICNLIPNGKVCQQCCVLSTYGYGVAFISASYKAGYIAASTKTVLIAIHRGAQSCIVLPHPFNLMCVQEVIEGGYELIKEFTTFEKTNECLNKCEEKDHCSRFIPDRKAEGSYRFNNWSLRYPGF